MLVNDTKSTELHLQIAKQAKIHTSLCDKQGKYPKSDAYKLTRTTTKLTFLQLITYNKSVGQLLYTSATRRLMCLSHAVYFSKRSILCCLTQSEVENGCTLWQRRRHHGEHTGIQDRRHHGEINFLTVLHFYGRQPMMQELKCHQSLHLASPSNLKTRKIQ